MSTRSELEAEKEIQRNICKRQGRLFALSVERGYDSERFVTAFMRSKVAKGLDAPYNRYQWASEEYLLEELMDECERKIPKNDNVIDADVMYWMGYIYRFWHYYKNASSQTIYRIASFKILNRNYMYFHSMTPELAIEDFIEIKSQKAS